MFLCNDTYFPLSFFFFFFQAEDGIRDHCVTGVQTCALPISINGQMYGGMLLGKIGEDGEAFTDRKSTRLNSSHTVISYAVFCLKKKTWYFRYAGRDGTFGATKPELEDASLGCASVLGLDTTY